MTNMPSQIKPGFRKIGSLTENLTKLETMRDISQRKLNTLPVVLSIGPTKKVAYEKIGTDVFITGCGTKLVAGTYAQGVEELPSNRLSVTIASRFSPLMLRKNLSKDFDVVGYRIQGEVTAKHILECEKLLYPMDVDELSRILTKVELKTKRRESMDTKMMIVVFMEELMKYPADVVKYVLTKWPNKNTFFPDWHGLYDDLEYWTRPRRILHDAIATKLFDQESDG